MRALFCLLVAWGALTAGLHTPAYGAPLSVTPATTPPSVWGTALVDNDPFFGFEFSAFETPAFSLQSDPSGATNLSIDAVLTAGGGFTSGSLAITTMAGTDYLSGTLSDVGFVFETAGADTLELLFDVQSGSQASAFGASALATFVGDLDTGGALDFFTDGVFFADASFTLTGVQASSTPIPLPNSALLLLIALITLGVGAKRSVEI